jgi:hypothetical protein
MQAVPRDITGLEQVGAALDAALPVELRPATVLACRANAYTATFSSQIIECELGSGERVTLLCKHGATHPANPNYAYGGVGYEAGVYRDLLLPAGLAPVRCFGSWTDPIASETWLFVDYLDHALQAQDAPDQAHAMTLAAGWIGEFQAAVSKQRLTSRVPMRYDAAYYRPWAERTLQFAQALLDQFPWLPAVCGRYEEIVALLANRPETVIHGDYYADNTLFRNGTIFPIDWSWAAVAAGEIDLAALTDRWPDDVSARCEDAYRQARYPGGIDREDFHRTLSAARVYLHLRWLGHRQDWTVQEKRRWRFTQLRRSAEQAGLI